MKKCDLCGHEVERLFKSIDCELCPSCFESVEGEEPDTRAELPPIEPLTVPMDARMLRALEGQADIEGFVSVEAYAHSILYLVAVKVFLEDLADPETVEEEAAFTRELRDWLRWR